MVISRVRQADDYLRAWLDDPDGPTRNEVVDPVMIVFDFVARSLTFGPA